MALDPLFPVSAPVEYLPIHVRRGLIGATFAHDASWGSARPGVIAGLQVWAASSNLLRVGDGTALVVPTQSGNGAYLVANEGALDLPVPARHGTYTRVDYVVLQVFDTDVDGSGKRAAEVKVVSGTASPSPQQPSLPQGALLLAQVTVPSGTSPVSVVDRRSYTSPIGGVIPVFTGGLPSGSALRPGQPIWYQGKLQIWSGTSWVDAAPIPPGVGRMASGNVPVSSGTKVTSISFPPGRFTQTPVVVCNPATGSGDTGWNAAKPFNITTSGFSLFTNGGGGNYSWIAHQS